MCKRWTKSFGRHANVQRLRMQESQKKEGGRNPSSPLIPSQPLHASQAFCSYLMHLARKQLQCRLCGRKGKKRKLYSIWHNVGTCFSNFLPSLPLLPEVFPPLPHLDLPPFLFNNECTCRALSKMLVVNAQACILGKEWFLMIEEIWLHSFAYYK